MVNTVDRLIQQQIAEMRAIKAQGLVTDPRDAVVSTSLNATISGIVANDLNENHMGYVQFTPEDTSLIPFIQVWLSNIHVPDNDFGVDAGYLMPVKANPGYFYIVCPFISYNTTDTYSFDVHVTSLIPGSIEVGKT